MKKTGDLGEELAAKYLIEKGYRIIERNWRGEKEFKSPEIDIIADIDDGLVFIEVKTSTTDLFGQPQEWITPRKRRRIAEGAAIYLACKNQSDTNCRFDAIAIDLRTKPATINHIENAFSISDLDLQ
ncbi:MAG: YraN family protein [candidate division Zixibacteria bacterium]|nr:YraN family protein [candidate division Zixibacteria bacterium]